MNYRFPQSILWLVIGVLLPAMVKADEPLTFFGWSDQHVTVKGEAEHLIPAIDAMNGLTGTAYPPELGGEVQKPAFVFGCGDISEWPTAAARDAYNALITGRLKIPAYDIAGNHDDGGNSPSPTVKNWLISRHGALRYTFEKGGIHFLATYAEYDESLNNPAQPVSKAALDFIRSELEKIPPGRPVVVALHLCFDAITNRDELVSAFGNANVIMVLGGHYHKPSIHEYRGFRFVQLPSPQTTTKFTVIRIENGRLVVIPYDYEARAWDNNPRVRLNVALAKPKPTAQQGR